MRCLSLGVQGRGREHRPAQDGSRTFELGLARLRLQEIKLGVSSGLRPRRLTCLELPTRMNTHRLALVVLHPGLVGGSSIGPSR